MSGAITLEGGGGGELARVEGEVLHAVLERPFAPGSPVRMRVQVGGGGGEALPIQGKTIRSKKRDDGRFDVRMRLINLRREHREKLQSLG
jgi:hypothetical protein